MTGFIAAFAATFLLGTGARDQVLIAGLTAKLGKRVYLLAVGLLITALTVLAATWLAALIAAQLGIENTRPVALLACALAGLEMAMVRLRRLPAEPTRSLGAITLVLIAFQAVDAVRLASFALVLVSITPAFTAAGAVLGAMTALGAGWMLGQKFPAPRLAAIRGWLGIAICVMAGTFLLIPR